jgi:hypothetical protein
MNNSVVDKNLHEINNICIAEPKPPHYSGTSVIKLLHCVVILTRSSLAGDDQLLHMLCSMKAQVFETTALISFDSSTERVSLFIDKSHINFDSVQC